MEQKKILCDRCRQFFALGEIRYVAKGEGRVSLCNACREKHTAESTKGADTKKSTKQPYFCARCKYKFKFDAKGGAALKCPYCGKMDKIILDKPPRADKLLQEVDLE